MIVTKPKLHKFNYARIAPTDKFRNADYRLGKRQHNLVFLNGVLDNPTYQYELVTIPLLGGTYQFRINSVDNLGNINNGVTGNTAIDDLLWYPKNFLITDITGGTGNNNVTFTWEHPTGGSTATKYVIYGNGGTGYQIDRGTPLATISASLLTTTINGLADGDWFFVIEAIEETGYYGISGAGTVAVNGNYYEAGTFNSHPYYEIEGGGYYLYFVSLAGLWDAWCIDETLGEDFPGGVLYFSDGGYDVTPPANPAEWNSSNGTLPPPSCISLTVVTETVNYFVAESALPTNTVVPPGPNNPDEPPTNPFEGRDVVQNIQFMNKSVGKCGIEFLWYYGDLASHFRIYHDSGTGTIDWGTYAFRFARINSIVQSFVTDQIATVEGDVPYKFGIRAETPDGVIDTNEIEYEVLLDGKAPNEVTNLTVGDY